MCCSAGVHALCAAPYAGAAEVMRCVLLCMLKAAEHARYVLKLLEVIRCALQVLRVVLYVLEAMEGICYVLVLLEIRQLLAPISATACGRWA